MKLAYCLVQNAHKKIRGSFATSPITGGNNMSNQTTAPTKTRVEELVTIRNIQLEGRNALVADEVTTKSKVTRFVNKKTGELGTICKTKKVSEETKMVRFPLKEISSEELSIARESVIPSFVLKDYGKYYYAEIRKDMRMVAPLILGEHLCSATRADCQHLSALSDEDGGCQKVRDNEKEKKINRYPWITQGFETFNCDSGCNQFVVCKCEHYEKCIPKERKTKGVKELKVGLAQFVWPEVTTLAEVRRNVTKNLNGR
jgi:hypothetical protein